MVKNEVGTAIITIDTEKTQFHEIVHWYHLHFRYLSPLNTAQKAQVSADAGLPAPDAQQNIAPKDVDNSNVNNSGTMLHPNTRSSASGEVMSRDDVHKNTMCKDGRCPDINKKVETGSHDDVNTKVGGTSQ